METNNIKTCHVVYRVNDVLSDSEFEVEFGRGVSTRLRKMIRDRYASPRFLHARIIILNITPLE